jgi:transcriptional regulator with XRE-family HTH domain
VDPGALLLKACERTRLSQAGLARRASTSPGAISDIIRGKVSPTVATLSRILAAAGLQVRAELEPLLADLDARLDAVLEAAPPLEAAPIQRLRTVLDEQALAWGLDGETALRAHGLGFAVPSDRPQVALAFDAAARSWFFRARVRGTGGDPVSWFDAEVGAAQAYLGGMAFGPFGMAAVRLLEDPPRTVRVEVAPGLVVPVLTVDEVTRGRPDLGEVVERLRARSLGS